MKSVAFALLGLLLSSMVLRAEVISGKVVAVLDGNTLEVFTSENETYKILLYGIDCPELGQEFGERAKMFLEKLVLNKSVNAEIQGKDRWGNRLAIVLIDGKDPREELLQEGLAWTAERNPIETFESMKEKAKQKGKGLWKDQEPTPPWIYRRQQTMTQFKSS
ncbi:MAG: thermonuclease family protein [Bacteroidota bacterium]|nr:thermonuclease family protein [Cytophagales bacterium]MCE2958503.1 thermonuclease family protein [Flammeovirgaceae bacterium]MCZ8069517.1 thermonuclease family protein [Cytophagales bacterium]